MKNFELSSKYDQIYKEGAYAKYFSFNSFPAQKLIIDYITSWVDLEVLDIGCGEGNLAAMLSFAGARKVDAVDFSSEAIEKARHRIHLENVNFICSKYRTMKNKYDVVVMNGVLEHFDNPWKELKYIIDNRLKKDGVVITTSPSFLNPRGYVWMTLQLLFDIPMSLTDLHFLCPFNFEGFCDKYGYSIDYKSTDQDWGAGERTIVDFRKRLKNALRDANMKDDGVDMFLSWLQKAVQYFPRNEYTGATIAYKIGKAKNLK